MYSIGELFTRSKEFYFGVYFPSCGAATRDMNTTITLKWAHKQVVTTVHTLFYFLHEVKNPYLPIKNDDFHTSSPCLSHSVYTMLMASQPIADYITMTITVTQARGKWYLTREISILFTAIFTAGRVRKSLFADWHTFLQISSLQIFVLFYFRKFEQKIFPCLCRCIFFQIIYMNTLTANKIANCRHVLLHMVI